MIILDNVGKAYRKKKRDITWIFRNIDATFDDQHNIGILGAAGSGKTTLIDLLSGNDVPSEGQIHRLGRISWPYNYRGNVVNKLTGKQNLRFLADIYGGNFSEILDFVCEFSEIGKMIDQPMKNYSGEMKNRLSVSALFALRFDCLLIDDDINLGDGTFRKKAAQYLIDNAHRQRLIIASSDLQLIMRHCQIGGVLHNGRLKMYPTVQAAVLAYNATSPLYA